MTRLWIDVEDLFRYAAFSPRPSGIQRLAFELQRALVEHPAAAGQVRFLRHDPLHAGFAEVPWRDVVALFEGMVGPASGKPPGRRAGTPFRPGAVRGVLGRFSDRFPAAVREPLARGVRVQRASLGTLRQAARLQRESWRSLAGALGAALRPPRTGPYAPLPQGAAESFANAVQPGDVLFAAGSPWWHHDYAGLVARTRDRHGLRFALLVYDLIPLLHPEWCDRGLIASFSEWLDGTLPQADLLLSISQSTARDVEAHAVRHGLALPGPVTPIPIGTGFGAPPAAAPASPGLPPPGSYVLFVSTIEARKNHALLFRVWRRLLQDLPPERVPTLVFAGRVGWLVADLLQQLDNTAWLDGKVLLVEDPTDADLAALYRGCQFTVFPSLYEGWGLPVTESLAFGKPCVIARGSSLPEAGGRLARYFDPDDLHDAVRAIRAAIEDPEGLAAWEARVRAEFQPVPWSASAEAVLRAFGIAG